MTKASYEQLANNTNPTWWKDPGLRKNVYFSIGCMLCPVYLGYDQSLLVGLQALPKWQEDFDHPKGYWLGLITASIMLPALVMGFPASWFCMRWGHRWCVMLGCIITLVGAVWNAMSPNSTHFILSRVAAGAGGTMSKIAAPALLQETAHPRIRSPLSYMYFACYYIGSIFSATVSLVGLQISGSWSWRLPCLLMGAVPLLICIILYPAPESPRYRVHKGQNGKALEMLARYHANGDINDPLVKWELSEIEYALEEETVNNKASYLDFFKTAGNRKRIAVALTFAIGANWIGNGIVSYYLTPILKTLGVSSPTKILSINLGLGVWNLILAQWAGFNIDNFGRRPLLLISTIGLACSYAFVMAFSGTFAETGNTAYGIAAVPFLFFFFGFYDIAWTPLNYAYVVEIMPFHLRTKAIALYNFVQQLGNSFNQFVNPIALEAIAWRYYGVYIGIECFYVVIIYFFFPETKKMSIEEVGMVFDYGMKEGRARATAAFEARMQQQMVGKDVEMDKRGGAEHLEDSDKNGAGNGTLDIKQ